MKTRFIVNPRSGGAGRTLGPMRDFAAREGVKLSFLPFFAKAACEALREYPSVNARIDQEAGTITYFDAEHIGVAVDTERGLLVPVVRDAGTMNLAALSQRIADAIVPVVLIGAWLAGQIWPTRSLALRVVATATALALTTASAAAIATVRDARAQFQDARLSEGLGRLSANLSARRARLVEPWNRRVMSEETADVLIPFFRYLERCTTPADRVLVPGFHPNVQVYTGRPAAGGRLNIIPIYPNTPEARRRIVATVATQQVPFAVVSTRYKSMIWDAHPELGHYIDTQFRSLRTYPIYGSGTDRKSTRLNSSHTDISRMPSSA